MPTPPLFKQYEALDLQAIEQMIQDKRQEDLHLEFKSIKNVNGLTKDDRKNLAKALSGFANSDGGLVVWGVTAKKDETDVDAACGESPIENVNAVLSIFQSLTGDAVNPIVDGVEHKAVNKGADSGFIVTYVPASESPPHMAKQGEGRYYRRSGDSFYKMEHFDLEDMFGRRPHPRLSPKIEVFPEGRSGNEQSLGVRLGIHNSGMGIARFPMIRFQLSRPYELSRFGLDSNSDNKLIWTHEPATNGGTYTFRGGVNDVVHVDSTLPITFIGLNGLGIVPLTQLQDIQICYTISAEGVRASEGEVVFTAYQLALDA